MIQPTVFTITTLLLLALTIWVIHTRYRSPLDSNWPLFYYLALFAYSRKFDQVLDSRVIFAVTIVAMLLRFEFLGGWVAKLLMFLETLGLIYVMIRCVQAVFGSG